MKKILVPLDGSPLASAVLPHAAHLAQCAAAELILMRALPDHGYNMGSEGASLLELQMLYCHGDALTQATERARRAEMVAQPPATPAELVQLQEAVARWLAAIADEWSKHGVPVRTRVVLGPPAEAILDMADEERADLIALATHGRGGIGRFLLGSVAERVAHHAQVPVLLLRAASLARQGGEDTHLCRRILVPLDGSDLAQAVLPVAYDLARCTAASVVLLRVIPEPVMDIVEAPAKLLLGNLPRDSTHDKRIEYERETAQRSLDAVAHTFVAREIPVETLVRFGQPAETILDVAQSVGADLIAMATHGCSGIRRFLLGSVADRVVRHAHVPVVLVRAHPQPQT